MEASCSNVASACARTLLRVIAALMVIAVLLATGHVANASPSSSDVPGSETLLARDPLAGRFGSTRDDFEAVYGEPIAEGSQEPPYGEAYAVSDFGGGTAYAYFHDDRLIYLQFTPDDGDRATSEIVDVLDTFLPGDYANGWMGDETAVSFVLNVQSTELASVVGKDVYEQYDAGIWVGDLHAYALGTRDGKLISIEFGLGWGAKVFDPGIATDDGRDEEDEADRQDDEDDNRSDDDDDNSTGTSPAEVDAYVATLTASFEEISASIDDFYALINDPNVDLSDTQTIFDITMIFDVWLDTYQESLELTPPPGYEEVHEAYLGFTDALAQAATSFTSDIEAAVAQLERAEEQGAILLELLEDASWPAIFDVKSGYARL